MAPDAEVAIRIRTALAQHLKRDVSKVRPQDDLRKDLSLDSLAMIELLFKIEEAFDLEIPNEDLSQIATVGDVIGYVERRLVAPAPRPGSPLPEAARSVAPPPAPAAARPAAPVAPVPKPAPAAKTARTGTPAKNTGAPAKKKRSARA